MTLMVYTDYTTFRPVETLLIQGPTICPLKRGVGDLVCVQFFFLKPLVIELFFLTNSGVRFFSSVIRYDDTFSAQDFFSPGISLQDLFFPSKSVYRIYFFLSHPYPSVKSQMVGLLSTSIVPSQIKGPKNYVQLQHLHPIEIHWKVYLRKFQILC